MKSAKWIVYVVVVLGGLVFLGLRHRTVVDIYTEPSGRYRSIISYRSYLSALPMPPGSSSDKPGFVKIEGTDGTDYGEIPVPMLQLSYVEWSETGASINLIGEWDFEKKTCYYWSEDGKQQIFVKGRP